MLLSFRTARVYLINMHSNMVYSSIFPQQQHHNITLLPLGSDSADVAMEGWKQVSFYHSLLQNEAAVMIISGSNDNKTHTFTSHFLYISPFCLKAFGNNHTISVGHFREVDAGPLYIIHACAKVVSTAEIGKIIAVCRRICASRVVNPNSLFP